MKAEDLHLLEVLDLQPERGSIRFKDRRMLLWDADAFGNLRRELIQTVGLEPARSILRRFPCARPDVLLWRRPMCLTRSR